MTASRPVAVQGVSRETAERLGAYTALALRWTRRINLVGPTSAGDFDTRHIQDCLQLAPLLPTATALAADIGSGAGLPGLVLSLATGIEFLLIESDLRKCAFLNEAIRVTRAPARVVAARAEQVHSKVDIITARAVAPLTTLLAWSHGLLRPGGCCLFLKGARFAAELADAEMWWSMEVDIIPSQTSAAGRILVIRSLCRRGRLTEDGGSGL